MKKSKENAKKDAQITVSREELQEIVSGYLYMTLSDLGYKKKEVKPIIQRLERKIVKNDYKEAMTAYENAEDILFPLTVMGVRIPIEYYDFKIDDFWYSDKVLGKRITKALNNAKIYAIKDFQDNDDIASELQKLRAFGRSMEDEFVIALKRVIGELPATAEIVGLPGIIAGIKVPPELYDVEIWQLDYKNTMSQSKIVFALRGRDIKRVKDLFKPENADITNLGLGKTALSSFLEALKRTIGERCEG